MNSINKKYSINKIVHIFWLGVFFLMVIVFLFLMSLFFFDGINKKLDKKMTCTVTSTEVVSETYSVGNGSGSYNGVLVKSKDCPDLIFTEMPDDIQGTNDLQRRLEPGHKYAFVYAYIKLPMDTTKAYSFNEK